MRKRDPTSRLPKLSEDEFAFKEGHPGRRYSCFKKHKMPVIPRISMPKDMICDIEHLEQHSEDCGGSAREMREKYAKAAMTLFYPF